MNGQDGAAGRPSRRGLLAGAGALVASALGASAVAGCGGSDSDPTATSAGSRPPSPHDASLLLGALELERRTIYAYVACIPLLHGDEAKAAEAWLDEELQHAGSLIGLIGAAGSKAPPRANSYDIGPHPRDRDQTVALLADLEQRQISHYLQIIPRLQWAPTRASVASVLNSDAQHIALLRVLAGKQPVPSAFVT